MKTSTREDLAERISERFERSGLDQYGLKVRCLGSTAVLQGIVDVLAEKSLAEEIALSTPGVHGVENAITVCTDGEVDDDDVAMEVAEELAATPLGTDVGCEVSGGKVRLVGRVANAAEAREAAETASKARGVRAVTHELAITPDGTADDPSLANAVEEELVDILGINARRVKISVDRGQVTIAGEVADDAVASRIEQTVAAIPGVRGVQNSVRTEPGVQERVIRDIRAEIEGDSHFDGAALVFAIDEGRLVVEGEIHDSETKRRLERVLRETLDKHRPFLRGLDNRVRFLR